MRQIDKPLRYVLSVLFIIGWLAVLSGMLSGCGDTSQTCELPTGTYKRIYTQQNATGACTKYANEPQFQQSFIQGKPVADGDECTARMESLTESQCDLQFVWTCESTSDGKETHAEWRETVSQHNDGFVLEGSRSIVLTVDDQTCKSSGTVRYEAQ